MMALDMTAQLAPIGLGMIGVLLASAAGILVAGLPQLNSARRAQRPVASLGTVTMPAAA